MKKIAFAAALLAMTTIAAPAFATSSHDDKYKAMMDAKFAEMDTNNDGMISMDENEAAAAKMFSEADTNGDKMISRDEMAAAMKKEWAKYKMDSNPVSNNTKTNKKTKH